jgi:hypothetical protein
MPSFFIIAFIWRGLIFPGSILLTTLPYSYRYSVIKCKHFRTGNDCRAAGKEPVARADNQDIVARADTGVSSDDMFCKRVLAFFDKFRHIIPDNHPVRRGGQGFLCPLCPFNAQRQPPVRCPDRGKPYSVKEYLADPAGGREDEPASFGKECCPDTAPELEVSDYLHPRERTVL